MKRFWFVLGLAFLITTIAGTARAHDPFEITAVARASSEELVVRVTMARSTALRLATGDRSTRATFAPEAFAGYRSRLEALAPSLYEITADGRRLTLRPSSARLTDEGDVELVAGATSPRGELLRFRASHLGVLPEGYTSALHFVESETKAGAFKLMTAADPVLDVRLKGNLTERSTGDSGYSLFRRFVVLGVEHVLAGYDHLLFLVGVLIACRGARGMLALVSCFTVAHSLTLALAALGHMSVSARIVEPLIAVSIAFVGLENLYGRHVLGRRMLVTFAFGLVHGLGFAGALDELSLEAGALPLALLSFNLGVELGQLAAAALALPLLMRLHATERGLWSLRLASMIVSGAGFFWFLERVA